MKVRENEVGKSLILDTGQLVRPCVPLRVLEACEGSEKEDYFGISKVC